MDPEKTVRKAQAAYDAGDINRIMELFDPEIVIYWDGRKEVDGLAEARTFHEEMYADLDERREYEVRKTLRAASGDTITVEWTATWIDSDGNHIEVYGGEFWTMRDGRLREWHAYSESYEHDETVDQRDDDYLGHY